MRMWMYLDSKRIKKKSWNLVYLPLNSSYSSPVNVIHLRIKRYFLSCCFWQGHKSTGARRGGPNAIEFCQRVAGFHQNVTIRRELWAGGRDDVGGSSARHRPGAHGPRHNARRTSEEDHEQRDGIASANVRHFAGFPRVTMTATSNPANGSYVEIGWLARNIAIPMDLTNSRRPDASPPQEARRRPTHVSSRTRDYLVRATMSSREYLFARK